LVLKHLLRMPFVVHVASPDESEFTQGRKT
jgi:hypothetical protein